MNNSPSRIVRRIEWDDAQEDNLRVFIEVPNFQNFGQRRSDLERKAWAAEYDDPPDKSIGSEANLEELCISVPEGESWNNILEARVDRFLTDWPQIRPAVLKAVFEFYKKIQPAARRIHNSPGSAFTLPEPTAPEVVADLFQISGIYLHHDETTIGIGGGCTWDLEHAWGALLRKGEIVEVGGIDMAF